MKPGFELVEHPADIGVRSWGHSREEVFAFAASGMFSLICDPMSVDRDETIEVTVTAEQPDLLLVAWLNELLYRFETGRMVFTEFEVEELDDRHVRARVHGEPLDQDRHIICGGVKAATLHDLALTQGPEGWEAFVLLDV
jgi:SHS2 domain-containing protein